MKGWVVFIGVIWCFFGEAQEAKLILPINLSHVPSTASFSANNRWVAIASKDDPAILIWEVQTGKLLKRLTGHERGIIDIKFSKSGLLASYSKDSSLIIWDIDKERIIKQNKLTSFIPERIEAFQDDLIEFFSIKRTYYEWYIKNDSIYQSVTVPYRRKQSKIQSPNKKYTLEVFGRMIQLKHNEYDSLTFVIQQHEKDILYYTFSRDDCYLLSSSFDGKTFIWNLKEKTMVCELKNRLLTTTKTSTNDSLKNVINTSWDGGPFIWNMESGSLMNFTEEEKKRAWSIYSVPNQNIFMVASESSNEISLYNIENSKLIRTIQIPKANGIWSISNGANNEEIIVSLKNKGAMVINWVKGEFINEIGSELTSSKSAYLDPSKKKIIIASTNGMTNIYSYLTNKKLSTINSIKGGFDAKFTQDGKLYGVAMGSGLLKIFDSNSNNQVHVFQHENRVNSFSFSEDSKLVASASYDNSVKVWSLKSGKLLYSLEHHNRCYSAEFVFNDKYIITTGADYQTCVWDAETGKKLYTRLQFKNGEWLIYDEHYRYDGTPGARNLLYFVCGTEIIELNQVKEALYVPNLAQRIMQGQEINYPVLRELDICDAFPIITPLDEKETYYSFRITERNLPLTFIEVYINNKNIFRLPVDKLKKVGGDYELLLEREEVEKHFIAGIGNDISVIGVVEDEGAELRSRGAKRLVSLEEKKKADPKVFSVFVGVSTYQDPSLNLHFTSKDAADLKSAFDKAAGKLLGDENVTSYLLHNDFTLNNADGSPNRNQIRDVFEKIAQIAEPQDMVLFFFAGHGEMTGQENKYLTLLTEEASVINKQGINTKDIKNWFSYDGPFEMLANKTILILDACNSGQATKELIAMARNEDESRRIRQVEDLKDKSGMFIFAASAANQSAYEMPQYQQGLMTYSLLHTLKNDPSILDDGDLLNLQKWFLNSEKYLGDLVKRHGLQQQAQPFGTANIRIAKVDEEVRSSIHLIGEKVMVVCGNVMNVETFTDDLDLREQLEQELTSISKRGTSNFAFSPRKIEGASLINIGYVSDGEKIKKANLKVLKNKEVIIEKEYKDTSVREMINEILKDINELNN